MYICFILMYIYNPLKSNSPVLITEKDLLPVIISQEIITPGCCFFLVTKYFFGNETLPKCYTKLKGIKHCYVKVFERLSLFAILTLKMSRNFVKLR